MIEYIGKIVWKSQSSIHARFMRACYLDFYWVLPNRNKFLIPSVILAAKMAESVIRMTEIRVPFPSWHAPCINLNERAHALHTPYYIYKEHGASSRVIHEIITNKKIHNHGKDYWNRLRHYELLRIRI